MNLLQLHIEHKLPDDFDGTLSDALRVIADYMETDESKAVATANAHAPDMTLPLKEWERQAINMLSDLNALNGTRTVAEVFLGQWETH